jgi:hypothetical protein
MTKKDNVTLTAGICNIPLTIPAIPYFISDSDNTTSEIEKVLRSFNIGYVKNKTASGRINIMGTHKIEAKIIKQIFRNFRTLKPRLISEWRYLFWEVDNQDQQYIDTVMNIYMYLKLPVYVHKSYRGFHFLSVKPIEKTTWDWAIQQLRKTNPRFPPVTLRVLANKHPNELDCYIQGFCYHPDNKTHRDTEYLKKFIEQQDIQSLEHYYMIVFYPLPKQTDLDNMTMEQRDIFQQEQVADSEDNRI